MAWGKNFGLTINFQQLIKWLHSRKWSRRVQDVAWSESYLACSSSRLLLSGRPVEKKSSMHGTHTQDKAKVASCQEMDNVTIFIWILCYIGVFIYVHQQPNNLSWSEHSLWTLFLKVNTEHSFWTQFLMIWTLDLSLYTPWVQVNWSSVEIRYNPAIMSRWKLKLTQGVPERGNTHSLAKEFSKILVFE